MIEISAESVVLSIIDLPNEEEKNETTDQHSSESHLHGTQQVPSIIASSAELVVTHTLELSSEE